MQDTALMLHTLLELGESMLADGADVRRVEQTLTRMGLAYGAVRMDVFVITSSIVLTMCFPDETSVTQTRRIEKSAVTDFRKLEAINAISRSYCEKPFPVQELADRLHLAKRCRPARWKLFAGSCLGAGALTVFFGGAGVSTASGIPDFRSTDGLYNQHYKYPPETILSHSFYMRKPEEFFKFYRDKMLCDTAKPNAAHLKLAELEQAGKLKAVITQNIDNLHQMAGSKHVLELHGSVYRNYCMRCGKSYDFKYHFIFII